MSTTKPKILCVDDEPHVLEGLRHTLRRRYQVETATSGQAGLAALAASKDIAVVISDMRMPQMDGAAFLDQVCQLDADIGRILLTGETDIALAQKAVNQGRIFRFLTKPCPPERLLADLETAVLCYQQRKLSRKAEEMLRHLNNQRTQLVANLSYELRTPLSGVHGAVETLRNALVGPVNAAQKELLDIAHGNLRHLEAVLDELLDFAKLDTGVVRLEVTAFRWRELWQDIHLTVLRRAQVKSIFVNVDLPAELPPCAADRKRLGQVVLNLLGNAIKFTPASGAVEFAVRAGPAHHVIQVKDTGEGIADTEIARIFDKFYRSPTPADRVLPGIGLGLAIVQDLVRMHGGEVSVQSRMGQGSIFTVTLPHRTLEDWAKIESDLAMEHAP